MNGEKLEQKNHVVSKKNHVPLGQRYVSDCITMVTYVMKGFWIAYLTWYMCNVQFQCWQRIITYIRKLLHKNDSVEQILHAIE